MSPYINNNTETLKMYLHFTRSKNYAVMTSSSATFINYQFHKNIPYLVAPNFSHTPRNSKSILLV